MAQPKHPVCAWPFGTLQFGDRFSLYQDIPERMNDKYADHSCFQYIRPSLGRCYTLLLWANTVELALFSVENKVEEFFLEGKYSGHSLDHTEKAWLDNTWCVGSDQKWGDRL